MSTDNSSGDQMIPVLISELWMGPQTPVDLYVRLNGKFVLIAKANQAANVSDLSIFKNKKVDSVFVRKEDYRRLIGRKLAETDVIMNHPDVSTDKKTFFLKSALHTVINGISELGPSTESVGHARYISSHAVEMLESRPLLVDILKALQDSSDWILNHSLGTSLFSVMIAQEMGWQNSQTLEKLALGGLLQDIGLKELPEVVRTKPRGALSYEERQLFESHPHRSMKLLQTVGDVSDDVLSIVFEHHENSMGLGYPRHLRDLKMSPLAKVVSLAVGVCELVLISPDNPQHRSVDEAIHQIERVMGQPYNKEAFRALKELSKNGRPRLAPVKIA